MVAVTCTTTYIYIYITYFVKWLNFADPCTYKLNYFQCRIVLGIPHDIHTPLLRFKFKMTASDSPA